jgi:ketosteroid isomerase-like protein
LSEQNVELHRRLIDAYNARDTEAFIALCDPEIAVHSSFAAPGGAVYRGHHGVRKWHRDLEEAWGDDFSVEPEAFFDLGDDTLMFAVLHGHGLQSGVEVEMPNAQVARLRDDLIVYLKVYMHREDALADLGVTEDELEPHNPSRQR